MTLDKKRIKALCFDVDGTLRDTDDAYTNHLEKIISPFSKINSNWDIKNTARKIIMGIEGPANLIYSIPDRLGIDDEFANFSNWLHRVGLLKNKQNKKFLVIDGVEKTLKSFYPKYPMVVISARGKRGTEDFLTTCGFENYFKEIVSAQTAHRTKPHPAPIYWAAKKMSVLPENCLMIGDTTVDILSGKRAGAQTVGVLSGFGNEKELIEKGADLIVESVADLPDILLNL